jgi:hypothetical protein
MRAGLEPVSYQVEFQSAISDRDFSVNLVMKQ